VKKITLLTAALLSLTLLAGCPEEQKTVKNQQAAKAAQAANSISFAENAEIDNIKQRLQLTSNPGLVGYIVLLNESGQPIMYTGVKGKVTSGSKRLTEPDRYTPQGTNGFIRQSPSDEGTYGSSGEYVFYWTPSGQYVQWNGKYLYSDKPFRLSVQPLVVDVNVK
jgi:outer membrane murein-binding lipoprotein Lpp